MPRKIDLSLLEPMLDAGNDFELSPSEYERIIGKAMPETESYLKYSSPVAQMAKDKGYRLFVEEKIAVQKTLVFKSLNCQVKCNT